MTLNDFERQNRGFYGFFWQFRAATQACIIHKVVLSLPVCDPGRELGICILT